MSATALAALREADGEVRGRQRLARAALRAEDADEARALDRHRGLGALLAREQLVDLEANLLGSRREHDDVVCAGLERAPEEAVGRSVSQNHDVQVGVLAGHGVQEQQGAVRVAGAGDEQQVCDAVSQPLQASSAPDTTATTLNSSSAGSESCTFSTSTPGSTARSALTGRLGISRFRSTSKSDAAVAVTWLRLLRAHDRADDEVELRVVGVQVLAASFVLTRRTRFEPPPGPARPAS